LFSFGSEEELVLAEERLGDNEDAVKIFFHQRDSIAVPGLSLSLNCNRVRVEGYCFVVRDDDDDG
jgi:hypothetical protein